jgi:predicted DCC family thiol-disulfide oxidoreductase YuxK
MAWLEPAGGRHSERVFVRSAAALRVARYLGGWWRLALAGWIIPAPIRDSVYNLIATHRHALVPTSKCAIPAPHQQARFLT